ncbi:MAG TPA: long-chain fatty acid--CoA ligase [Actinomycetota bacterium]|nr:long-chain fatty acid--CoA ligase [Actinomycetota bacterium]
MADGLRRSANSRPDHPALVSHSERVSYRMLDRNADRVAAGLHKIGIRDGDRVAFSLPNTPDFASVYFGVLRAGAVSVPLNTSLKAAELRPYLTGVAPRVIISDESAIGEIMSAGPFSAPVYVVGKHPTARPFDQLLDGGPPPEVTVGDEDLAVLAYTSGTSGGQKAAMLTHGNLKSNINQVLALPMGRTSADDVVLGVLPLFHIYALNVILGLSIDQGATVVLEERFDPVGTMRRVARDGVTIIVGAPPMYIAWLAALNPSDFDLSSVRFAVSGASALSAQVIDDFREKFGIEIWEGYGLTETSPTLTTTRMGEQRPGSVGKPVEGVELRVVCESGEGAVTGDPGEVWVKGPNVFNGYWNDEEATAAAFADGWFRTGDLGYLDEDGYLWLVDRKKELIIVSGFNVYPKEVEDVILRHPAVIDAAVVGIPHERQGEAVKAFVVRRQDQQASEEEIIVHCTRQLARFKVPTEVEFVAELPHLATGKVLKRMLRPPELGQVH